MATFQQPAAVSMRISPLLLSLLLLFSLQWADGVYVPPGPKYPCPAEPKQIYPCVCLQGADTGLVWHRLSLFLLFFFPSINQLYLHL